MKFTFCGGLDAPDWILSEVELLSGIPAAKIKFLSGLVLEELLGRGMNYEQLQTLSEDVLAAKTDLKAAVAAVTFMIFNAGKYDVNEKILQTELQQLGLPKDSTMAIVSTFTSAKDDLQQSLKNSTLQLPRLINTEWRVDSILSSSAALEAMHGTVHFKLTTDKGLQGNSKKAEHHAFEVSPDKFRVLFGELRDARKMFDA